MNIEKLQDYQCSGCCACANACPRNAITMRENMEGFIYPVIDHALCIECSACDRACTQVHEWLQEEDMLNRNSVPQAYAVINNNPLTRDKSSSGGYSDFWRKKLSTKAELYMVHLSTKNGRCFMAV